MNSYPQSEQTILAGAGLADHDRAIPADMPPCSCTDNVPQQPVRSKIDLLDIFEGTLKGVVLFGSRYLVTLWYLAFRPVRTMQLLHHEPAALLRPLSFLFTSILLVTLASPFWVDIHAAQALDVVHMAAPLADEQANRTLNEQLRGISLTSFLLTTAPIGALVLLLTFLTTRILGDRRSFFDSPLVAALMLVVGYRLFVRFLLALADLVFAVSPLILGSLGLEPAKGNWNTWILLLSLPSTLLLLYSVLIAGCPHLWIALRQSDVRFWQTHRWLAVPVAALVASTVYLASLLAPTMVNQSLAATRELVQSALAGNQTAAISWEPLTEAVLAMEADDDVYLQASLLVRNPLEQGIVLMLPEYVAVSSEGTVAPCQAYLAGQSGLQILDARESAVVTIHVQVGRGQAEQLQISRQMIAPLRFVSVSGDNGCELYATLDLNDAAWRQLGNDHNRQRLTHRSQVPDPTNGPHNEPGRTARQESPRGWE